MNILKKTLIKLLIKKTVNITASLVKGYNDDLLKLQQRLNYNINTDEESSKKGQEYYAEQDYITEQYSADVINLVLDFINYDLNIVQEFKIKRILKNCSTDDLNLLIEEIVSILEDPRVNNGFIYSLNYYAHSLKDGYYISNV